MKEIKSIYKYIKTKQKLQTMKRFEMLSEIKNHLIKDGVTNDCANKAMSIIQNNWKQIYDDGGINPMLKEEIQKTGVEFDHINNIVQTITA